jgi:DNA-binding MarR family transcriptional regulator
LSFTPLKFYNFNTKQKTTGGKAVAIAANAPQYDMSGLVLIELRKIIQAIDRNSKSLVRRVGLTMPQLIILQYICRQTEASVGVIAKNNSLSDATVTGILERLERRCLIVKRKSTSDRRRVLIKITEIGKELIKKAPPAMQEGFVTSFNELPGWNQAMIYSALQQLAGIMNVSTLPASPFLTVNPVIEDQ